MSIEHKVSKSPIKELSCRRLTITLVAALAVFIAGQWQILTYYWSVWNHKESYYSHGPMVPILGALMLWQNRGRLQLSGIRGSWIGIVLLIAAAILSLVGLGFGWEPICGIAFILSALGLVWALLGTQGIRVLCIPVLFFSMMIPAPNSLLDIWTSRMQLVSSYIAAYTLQITGYDVTLRGNIITSDSLPVPLLVGGPCSGLKLLIALIMCSWFIAYMVESPGWKKAVLIAMAFPLSIVVNSIRVVLIAYAGIWTFSSDAVRTFHDYSGYIGLLLCVVVVYGLARLIGMRQFRVFGDDNAVPTPGPHSAVLASRTAVVAIVVLALGAAANTAVGGLYSLPKGQLDRAGIPMSVGTWRGHEMDIDERTREALSKGDLMSLVYTSDHQPGKSINLFLDASLDLTAFHSPNICLPGSGYRITSDRVIDLHFERPREMSIKAVMLHLEGELDSAVMIYWYQFGQETLPRASDLLALTHQRRLSDIKSLMRNPLALRDVRRNVSSREFTWYRFTMPMTDGEADEKTLRDFIAEFVANSQSPW